MPHPSPWEQLRQRLECPYVVLDTETTGLDEPEMVSVAIVRGDGQTILDRLVKPGKPIEPSAAAITGIDDAAVADAPSFPEVEPEVTKALSGRLVVIYNADYDVSVLRNTYARYGLALPSFEAWCAMKWFAPIFGEWNERRGDFAWKSLAVAAEYFAIPQSAAHDALDDALTTWRILQAALRRAKPRPAEELTLFGEAPAS